MFDYCHLFHHGFSPIAVHHYVWAQGYTTSEIAQTLKDGLGSQKTHVLYRCHCGEKLRVKNLSGKWTMEDLKK